MAIQAVLGFVLVLLWGFAVLHKYRHDRCLENEMKNEWLSSSEFTLMLENYPLRLINSKNQEETVSNIQDLFQQYQQSLKSKLSFEVVKVSVGYPLSVW